MKTSILLFLIVLTINVYSQDNLQGLPGNKMIFNQNGQSRVITEPLIYNSGIINPVQSIVNYNNLIDNNSMIRWTFMDGAAIGDKCQVSGNGLYETVGWGLNNKRISLYSNTNNTPLWDYMTDPGAGYYYNNVAISDTGGVIAAASYHNIYMYNRPNSSPFFNFDLNTLPQLGIASAIDITSDGRFIVTCSSLSNATDSSTVMGFSRDSSGIVWRFKVGQTTAGGPAIQGIKICKNDSLAIVNTYGGFYVIKTYTGQIIYQGAINTSASGTQAPQGISGNGNIIATINYTGFVKVYQRSGNSYNLLWQHQEPPGTYYNWMTAVDVSYDGTMLAVGTLQFITSSTYDGKIKLFRVANGPTPVWTYIGMGDEVQAVSFSKNGNVLAASSWGNYYDPNTPNFLVFKVSNNVNVPIFQTNSPGSFFCSSVSNDGLTAIGSGKRVHARTFGNGGQAYNLLIDTNDAPVGIITNLNTPSSFKLYQNYPNPFNPSTQIKYDIPQQSFVTISIYDELGRIVKQLINKNQQAGQYSESFDASSLASGIYFYKLEVTPDNGNVYSEIKKMILMK